MMADLFPIWITILMILFVENEIIPEVVYYLSEMSNVDDQIGNKN